MTIAMIGQKGLPARSGGVERHVSLLASGLVSRGHRVVVYGRRWYVGNMQASAGIEQRFTSGIHTKHLDAITHTFTALFDARKLHPEIVHLHGVGTALLAPLARLIHPRAKIVVTFHCADSGHAKWNWFAKRMLRLGEWLACRLPHRTIVVSQTLLKDCLSRYQCQGAYISHPFAMPDEMPDTASLAEHGLEKDQYLLFVGRLVANKQAHLLIEAYAEARKQCPELFARLPLVIVGGGVWTDAYVKWLSQLGAAVPGVMFLGERFGKELAALQAHAMAHVFPTSTEGLSYSMIEAAAFKRPSVITELPQNREAIGCGSVEVRVNDAKDLARGLIEIASLPANVRTKMGEQSRAHVEKAFHFIDRIDDVDRLYHELVVGDERLTSQLKLAQKNV
jgi:glycosyltransferase involved in cell wall biosynthesis